MSPKKLIEVSIPLEQINKESAREKSIRHSHPSTLHLWWARRPLAAARAVLWASLVDDPSEHPEKFPTPEAQDKERERLKDILAKFADWDNINNPDITAKALAELPASLPELLDPFAGGGSIPLEGQRLGLNVHAHDLNPIAVIINKAMVEIPPLYAGCPAIHPDNQRKLDFTNQKSECKAAGLADDIKYYGEILKQKALSKIGGMYPKIHTPCGDATVIAWLWARTVKCPNPACGCDMPLASSFILSKKKGRSAWAVPHITKHSISFTVETSGTPPQEVKTGRGKFRCSVCGASAGTDYLHEQFTAHRDGRVMLAVVAEGRNGRLYLAPDDEQVKAADVPMPEDFPDAEMNQDTTDLISGRGYGFTHWHQLFTNRQLTMLTAFADLIPEVREEICADARKRGVPAPEAYADAVSVYLAFAVDKMTIFHSSFCPWNTVGEKIENCFGRQAIPMIWDYAEGNPFSGSSGCFSHMLGWVFDVVKKLPARAKGEASQHNAQTPGILHNVMISTDPPYYDNIGYADLSDYFYIWLRRTLRSIYPELFRRVLVPKSEELVAAPYRHGWKADSARKFFEDGMSAALKNVYACACDDYPVTIYYAYKQKESDSDGESSAGWETMLNAVVNAGFQITGTWPVRTERPVALKANVAALASSVVLVCRKRGENAPGTTKGAFDVELKAALEEGLEVLRKGNIAPVDIPQAAIGKGMAVFSKYKEIVDIDGHSMTVRDALKEIDGLLDPDAMKDIDGVSRFCVKLYTLSGCEAVSSDDAEKITRQTGIAVKDVERAWLVVSEGGKVRLTERRYLLRKPKDWAGMSLWAAAQMMTEAMSARGGGVESCAGIFAALGSGRAELVRELVYRLYSAAERRGMSEDTVLYNNLILSWQKIRERAGGIRPNTVQFVLNFEKEEAEKK